MTQLQHEESVALVLALVMRAAESVSVRALAIKGPTLSAQGLRQKRVSADVDVLVGPNDFEVLKRHLLSLGWWDRDSQVFSPLPNAAVVFAEHSVTLVHPHFSNNLDLHRFYPGFLDAPQRVFDELWSNRQNHWIAHTPCAVPHIVDHWMIALLHVIRSHDASQRAQLQQWLARRDDHELAYIVARAVLLGTIDTLRDELLAVSAPVPAGSERQSALLDDWKSMIAGESPRGARLLSALRRAPWSEKPRLVWRALFPPITVLRLFHQVPDGRVAILVFRTRMLFQAVLQAPRTARYLVLQRRKRM